MRRRLAAALLLWTAAAQGAAAAEPVPAVVLPNLWDPQRQIDKPDLGTLRQIRFLTTDDDPPFHFALADGTLIGFDVDLARAVCGELNVTCTIQARRRDTLLETLRAGGGDVLLVPVGAAARGADLQTTAPYYTTPARFVVAASSTLANATPATLAGQRVGVAEGTAQDLYLGRFFPGVARVGFATEADARDALKGGAVAAVLADAIAASLWLNGSDSGACCRFLDGPFTESRIFGDGVGMVVRRDGSPLRRALDYALAAAAAHGSYSDIYLKYFPIGFY